VQYRRHKSYMRETCYNVKHAQKHAQNKIPEADKSSIAGPFIKRSLFIFILRHQSCRQHDPTPECRLFTQSWVTPWYAWVGIDVRVSRSSRIGSSSAGSLIVNRSYSQRHLSVGESVVWHVYQWGCCCCCRLRVMLPLLTVVVVYGPIDHDGPDQHAGDDDDDLQGCCVK